MMHLHGHGSHVLWMSAGLLSLVEHMAGDGNTGVPGASADGRCGWLTFG